MSLVCNLWCACLCLHLLNSLYRTHGNSVLLENGMVGTGVSIYLTKILKVWAKATIDIRGWIKWKWKYTMCNCMCLGLQGVREGALQTPPVLAEKAVNNNCWARVSNLSDCFFPDKSSLWESPGTPQTLEHIPIWTKMARLEGFHLISMDTLAQWEIFSPVLVNQC